MREKQGMQGNEGGMCMERSREHTDEMKPTNRDHPRADSRVSLEHAPTRSSPGRPPGLMRPKKMLQQEHSNIHA